LTKVALTPNPEGVTARDADSLRAFLGLDWAARARAKEDAWRSFKREHGPAGSLRIADDLYRQATLARPGWPTARDREEDLAAHLRVAEIIRRVPARSR
jgi:hypothetical protein